MAFLQNNFNNQKEGRIFITKSLLILCIIAWLSLSLHFASAVDREQDCSTCDYQVQKAISRIQFLEQIYAGYRVDSALELGPLINPILSGPMVKYFDTLNRTEIMAYAASIPDYESIPLEKAPEIDYVDPNADLAIIKERFDLILSSHCIEHQIDLVEHFQHIERLLEKHGVYFLIIPDKRYTFDHFRPLTTLTEILSTYWSRSNTEALGLNKGLHSLRTVIDYKCSVTHNIVSEHWLGNHGEPVSSTDPGCFERVSEEYYSRHGSYIDAHNTILTPCSFCSIVSHLNKMNLINLKIKEIYETKQYCGEFFVIMGH